MSLSRDQAGVGGTTAKNGASIQGGDVEVGKPLASIAAIGSGPGELLHNTSIWLDGFSLHIGQDGTAGSANYDQHDPAQFTSIREDVNNQSYAQVSSGAASLNNTDKIAGGNSQALAGTLEAILSMVDGGNSSWFRAFKINQAEAKGNLNLVTYPPARNDSVLFPPGNFLYTAADIVAGLAPAGGPKAGMLKSAPISALVGAITGVYNPAVDCVKPPETVALTPNGFAKVRPSQRVLVATGAQVARVGEYEMIVINGAGGSVVFSDRAICDTMQTTVKNASAGAVAVSVAAGTIDGVAAAVITLAPRVAVGPAFSLGDLGESVDILTTGAGVFFAH